MKDCVDLGSRRELFVDRYLIEQMESVDLRLQIPQRMPLARHPVTGNYMTVIQDGPLYRAYYRDVIPGYDGAVFDGHPGEGTCYAESRDGHEWSFPDLGLVDVETPKGRNAILKEEPFSHNFSPFLDANPRAKPSERYKAVAGSHSTKHAVKGLCLFVSADGLRWRKKRVKPVIALSEFGLDSQNVAFWSVAEEQYLCYLRTWDRTDGKLRSVSRATSEDGLTWSDLVPMAPNLPGEHLYTTQTHPYFRAPHIYIALPTRFIHGMVQGNKVVNEEGAVLNLGSTDILFMSSRAGTETYCRPFTEAFIPPGLDPARWQSRGNYAALNVVPTSPEEMSIYHAKSGHRYVLRTDGFASVRAGVVEGELLTRPVTFEGDELTVNFGTSAAGRLRVEIEDLHGVPVPGFTLADCPPLVGDEIDRVVRWTGGAALSGLAGRPVRLRFVLMECDLYAFQFRPHPAG